MKSRIAAALSFLFLLVGLAGCGGGTSAVQPPPPPPSGVSINSIAPTSAAAGSADLRLTLTGSNFLGKPHNLSQAAWSANGSVTLLATTFVSSTQLTAVVPAALLTNPVTAQVLLETGDPMGDVPLSKSNSVSFSVSKPKPSASITSISPTSAVADSPDLNLTVTGSNFAGDAFFFSQVVWSANGNKTSLDTKRVSSAQLTAVIPASLLKNPVSAQVFVQTLDQDGTPQFASNSLNFSVNASAASTVSPTLVTLGPTGTQQFVATVNGNIADATWAIEEGASGGSITSTGLYTVPAHLGTFHVTATLVADPSKSAAATVTAVASGFTETGNMSTPRSGHTATLLANGKVLIVGGGAGPEATAELFDPATATFSLTGSMTTPRIGATATLLANGKVLIAGGFGTTPASDGSLPRLISAELYDPQSGKFSATGSMTVGRILHTATLLNDGRLLIAGGTDGDGGGGAATSSTELYDPATGSFALTGNMLSERAQHTATLLPSGKALIIGGWNGHAADSVDDPPWDPLFAELFDPSSGTYKSTGSMSTTRIRHGAIRLADGRVLVLGGVPSLQNIHAQPPDPQYAELYDPAVGTFSSVGDFKLSRTAYTATLLTNGMVLIAGGEQAGIAVTSAELLDPATGTLSATGGLVVERKGHTATRLNDGRVLVTGGVDSNGNALASAELYQ